MSKYNVGDTVIAEVYVNDVPHTKKCEVIAVDEYNGIVQYALSFKISTVCTERDIYEKI